MEMSLDHLWRLSYESKLIDVLRDAKFAIPLIQSVHLIGITMVLGTAVVLNFRLLGLGWKELPVNVLATQLWRWAMRGLGLTICSGFLVFVPDPARYAANMAFRTKMILLCLAISFQLTIFRKTIRAKPSPAETARGMLVACVSL